MLAIFLIFFYWTWSHNIYYRSFLNHQFDTPQNTNLQILCPPATKYRSRDSTALLLKYKSYKISTKYSSGRGRILYRKENKIKRAHQKLFSHFHKTRDWEQFVMAVKIHTREFSPGARIPRTPGRRSRSWESGSADYLPSSSSWCASASGLYYSSSSSASASVSNSQDKYQYSASGRWNNLDPTRRNQKSSTQYTKEFRQSQSDSSAASTDRTHDGFN